MLQLFPLIDQNHAFGVDKPEPVNTSESHVLPVFGVGGLVHGGDVAKRLRFMKRRWWGRLERTQLREIVHRSRQLASGLGIDL